MSDVNARLQDLIIEHEQCIGRAHLLHALARPLIADAHARIMRTMGPACRKQRPPLMGGGAPFRSEWTRQPNHHSCAVNDHQPALAAALREPGTYLAANLEGYSDAALAAQLQAPAQEIWRLRLMGWPRVSDWALDVQAMAQALHADSGALEALLAELASPSGARS